MISTKLTGAAYSTAATSRLNKPAVVSNGDRDSLRKTEARKEDSVTLSRGTEEAKPSTYTRAGLLKGAKQDEVDAATKVDKREAELKTRELRDTSKSEERSDDQPAELRDSSRVAEQRSEQSRARSDAARERASVVEAEKLAARQPEANKSHEAEVRDASKRQAAEGRRKIEVRA